MSQRVKTSARGLVLPRSSSPENGHLRKNYYSLEKYLATVHIWYQQNNSCDMEQLDFKIFMTLHFLRAVKLSRIIFVVVIESKTPIYKVF
jgi:hypothetical protein